MMETGITELGDLIARILATAILAVVIGCMVWYGAEFIIFLIGTKKRKKK